MARILVVPVELFTVKKFSKTTGFVQVMENLESHGIL